MAKRGRKLLQARKEYRGDDSLLVRSAESLGRVIGSLQRQMQGSAKRASSIADDTMSMLPDLPRFDTLFGEAASSTRKRAAARTPRTRSRKTAAQSGARQSTGARKMSASRKRTASRKTTKKR
jgi:hypothetical protein